MIVIAGLVLGAMFGALLARKRGGNRLDMAQYGGVFAIIFAIAALFITIIVERMV